MSKKLLLLLLPVIVATFYVYSAMGNESKKIESVNKIIKPDSVSFEKLINSHRKSIGQKELVHDETLCKFASQRVSKLYKVDWRNLGHFEFEKDADASGLYGRPMQENIVEGPNEASMLKGLLGSKSHRETLESSENIFTCVAIENQLVVQVFAQK